MFQKDSGISLTSLNKIKVMKDTYELILVYYLVKETGIAKKEAQDRISENLDEISKLELMGGVKAEWRVHPENLLKILSKEASQNRSLI